MEEIPQTRFLAGISTQTIRNLLPRSISNTNQKMNSKSKSKSSKENTPPNVTPSSPSAPQKSPIKKVNFQKKTPISVQDESSVAPDPPVKVVVRIRPANWRERGEEWTVWKTSPNSISVGERKFTFDSVVDSSATQEDMFQLVGVPLVKNSLAGYNTSILSYGQTGSGKTYTMWGPPSAMLEDHSPSSNHGIVPRIFQMLFSEFQREQEKSEETHINYQCRCSFLEVYNEQIGDLLDPTRRNLQIRDDAKNNSYVENLTEEHVINYDDVTQILIKGLSNRKVGASSINSKSSRSHIIFTCVIESWCKGTSSKCFSSSKTSRITLVDLAGMEGNKVDDASRQCIKESKSVKKSLAQLGHLVHILSDDAQTEKPQNIPYRSSCLTYLLQKSLGGNAKLAVICAISPHDKCKGETVSTIRFGLRAKCIRNEPVVNEITDDDVNDLSDQIRQLKEELIKTKSTEYHSIDSYSGYFTGLHARESLNQLRISLNRSLILPTIDPDSEAEVTVDEEDITKLHFHLDNLHNSFEESLSDKESFQFVSCEEGSDTDATSEQSYSSKICLEASNNDKTHLVAADLISTHSTGLASLSIMPCRQSLILQDPPLCDSPKIGNIQKTLTPSSSNLLESRNSVSGTSKSIPEVLRQSVKRSDQIRASLRSSNLFSGPTESLAASLHRGLQIIDNHQRNSASNKSSVAFSFEHLAIKTCQESDKADASVQTLPEEGSDSDKVNTSFLCASCKRPGVNASNQVEGSLNMGIVPIDGDGEKVSAESPKRVELEKVCAEQVAKIEHLNQLVEQYKREREHAAAIGQNQEIRTLLDEPKGLIDEPQFLLEEGNKPKGLIDEPQFLLEEGNKVNVHDKNGDLIQLQEVTDHGIKNVPFDMNERDALLKENEDLRMKLQSLIDVPSNESPDKSEELKRERQRWTEMESEWISLTDELRIDLASNRRHKEKMEMELRLEKKVTEELDDAINRAVLGHGRMVEHYADLQEKHNELLGRHRKIMEGITEVQKAASRAGKKGNGARFAKSLAAELSSLRVEREREREHLKKENKCLRIQLRDTAEAVHAAGELLVRLREAEEAALVAEESYMGAKKDIEKIRKQLEKQKRKHAMEMVTMKQYLAESRLPQSALQPLHWQDNNTEDSNTTPPLRDDDQSWRAEFRPVYQENY
ncbi:hypothetical protein GIB67_014120 [Kingdonia uniflora]|uniref:Kinesin motor domain-containing protein n=1 Tax=Kingdonia uniflora TaxID=39325 RepID=A0A7J7N4T5_9MAGN|nr:hypothetical protein GIB67_014120 [Kingdonia uniflora]